MKEREREKEKKKKQKKKKRKKKKKKKKELETRESLRKGLDDVSCLLFSFDFASKIAGKKVEMRLQMSLGGFVGPSASP